MISNKVKRNIWLTLGVVSLVCVMAVAVKVYEGTSEWWQLLCSAVICGVIFRLFWIYRKQVKAGNIFGRVDPLDKKEN